MQQESLAELAAQGEWGNKGQLVQQEEWGQRGPQVKQEHLVSELSMYMQ